MRVSERIILTLLLTTTLPAMADDKPLPAAIAAPGETWC